MKNCEWFFYFVRFDFHTVLLCLYVWTNVVLCGSLSLSLLMAQLVSLLCRLLTSMCNQVERLGFLRLASSLDRFLIVWYFCFTYATPLYFSFAWFFFFLITCENLFFFRASCFWFTFKLCDMYVNLPFFLIKFGPLVAHKSSCQMIADMPSSLLSAKHRCGRY